MTQQKELILIVDDSPLIRKIFVDSLCEEYTILEAADGVAATVYLDRERDRISALILDIVMPKLDGFGVLRYLRATGLLDRIPVLMITSDTEEERIAHAYDLGATEVIRKPFSRDIVKRRLRNIIDLYTQKNNLRDTVRRQTASLELQARKLREINDQTIDTLSAIIEYRSLESGQHTRRLRGFTKLLLSALPRSRFPFSPEEIDIISRASAMHDIGKIAIPDSILLKPGKLTSQEFEIMKTHTTKGCDILRRLSSLDDDLYLEYARQICRWHHERWDGRGYPDGLSGEDIPIAAQVVALADVYDALTHKRVYKDAYSITETANMIFQGECGNFSDLLLDCFRQMLPSFIHLSVTYRDDLV